jgi:NhaA family Na+:H+ antiporter
VKENRKGALAFLEHEAAGGVTLFAAAALALIFSNSALRSLYNAFLETPVSVRVGALSIDKPLLLWINDGLMAIFFFLVGLETKRELLRGELSSLDRAALPAIAALGGMALPAMIYAMINMGDTVRLHGWAIPAATDIAFAVTVLALVGARIPPSLKIFLLALAILDDLGAIVIIALFYTAHLSVTSLLLAGAGIIALLVLNLRGTARLAPYALVGSFIWVCVLKSGVHATLAGVVVALAIPLRIAATPYTPLEQVEDNLHPWVAFGVLPLFGFANAGVSLEGLSFAKLLESIPLGIALGLFLGKQVGILGFTWRAVRLGLCRKPVGATWSQIYGVAVLGGIGFTMSLFIGTLAFPDPAYASDVRIGVLAGSLLSATIGFVVLKYIAAADPARDARHGEKSSR